MRVDKNNGNLIESLFQQGYKQIQDAMLKPVGSSEFTYNGKAINMQNDPYKVFDGKVENKKPYNMDIAGLNDPFTMMRGMPTYGRLTTKRG